MANSTTSNGSGTISLNSGGGITTTTTNNISTLLSGTTSTGSLIGGGGTIGNIGSNQPATLHMKGASVSYFKSTEQFHLKMFSRAIQIDVSTKPSNMPFMSDLFVISVEGKERFTLKNGNNYGAFIGLINDKKDNKLTSYDANLKRLLCLYYIAKEISDLHGEDQKDNDFELYLNQTFKTVSIQMGSSGVRFYIYLGANGNSKIYTLYDFTPKYYPKKVDIELTYKMKLRDIQLMKDVIDRANKFSIKIYNYAKENNK